MWLENRHAWMAEESREWGEFPPLSVSDLERDSIGNTG